MFKPRYWIRVKLAVLTTFAVTGGAMFTSCGLSDIRDNLIAGALGAVEGAAANWVDGLLIDANEIFEATPDNPIDTP